MLGFTEPALIVSARACLLNARWPHQTDIDCGAESLRASLRTSRRRSPNSATSMMTTPTVSGLLDDLCHLAVEVLTPSVSCGITMREDHLPLTVASSDPLAAHLDEVQCGQDQGPCLQTLRTGKVTVVDDLAVEDRLAVLCHPRPGLRRGVDPAVPARSSAR